MKYSIIFTFFILSSCFAFADDNTKAFQAIKAGDQNTLSQMLSTGLDPNTKDPKGDSLVIYTLRFNQPSLRTLLCSKGATDKICTTPYDEKASILLRQLFANKTATPQNVKELLDAGADPSYSKVINHGSDYVYPPLIGAVFNKNVEIAQILISYGANINTRTLYQGSDYAQETALAWAAELNYSDLAKLFIEYGADPTIPFNEAAWRADTTYSAAVYNNNFEILELLLQHSDLKDTKTLLTDLACGLQLSKEQVSAAFPLYLKYGSDINYSNGANSVVRCLAYQKSLDSLSIAVSLGADPRLVNNLFEYNYSINLTTEVFNFLVAHGARASLKDLFDAAENSTDYLEKIIPIMRKDELFMGNPPIWAPYIYSDGKPVCGTSQKEQLELDALIRAGFDIDAPLSKPLLTTDSLSIAPTLLEYCASHLEIRQRLLKGGANPNKLDSTGKYTPLFLLKFSNHSDDLNILSDLLSAGGNPNLMTESGFNAAQYLIRKADFINVDKINLLKKFQTQFSMPAKDGRTFLHLYLFRDEVNLDVVKALVTEYPEAINAVARINLNMKISGIPLFLALDTDKLEIIQYLVEAGSNINTQTIGTNETPLHMMVFEHGSNALAIFEYFLKMNAKTDIKDVYGWTVRESAQRQNRQDLIDLLNKYGK